MAEVYERATASDNRAMMVNSNKRNWKKTRTRKAQAQSNALDATGRATRQENAEPTKRNSIANSAELKDTYPKPARRKKQRATTTKNQGTRIKRDR